MGKTLEELIQAGATPVGMPSPKTYEQLMAEGAAPSEMSEWRSAGEGIKQGGTLGFADEIGGGVQALARKATDVLPTGLLDVMGIESRYKDELDDAGTIYAKARDAERRTAEEARIANPKAYLGGEIVGGLVPTFAGGAIAGRALSAAPKSAAQLKALLDASRAARMTAGTASGTGYGAAYGAGSSEAESAGGIARDAGVGALVGGALGGALSGVGEGIGAVRSWANKGSQRAAADEAAKQGAKKAGAVASEAGGVGGESASVLRHQKELVEIVGDVSETPEVREAARQALADPRFAAALSRARKNYITNAPEKLGKLEAREAALAEARAIDVDAATAEALKDPFKKHVAPRIRTYASRSIPVAIGTAVGGPGGAMVGGTVATVLGKPGTAVANAAKTPAVRKGFYDLVANVVGREPRLMGKWATPLVEASKRGTQQLAAAHYVLAQRDPEYLRHLESLEGTERTAALSDR